MSLKAKNDKSNNQFHCPESGCIYFAGSPRFFTKKKFLNQHIAKVHAEKKYSCTKCHKSFGLDWWRQHHEKTCGTEWKCACGSRYGSWESLLTHSKRSRHTLPDHYLSGDKMKKNKLRPTPAEQPVIVLIQPIIQNWTCIQSTPESVALNQTQVQSCTDSAFRHILPKTLQPAMVALPLSLSPCKPSSNPGLPTSVVCDTTNESILFPGLTQSSGSEVSAPEANTTDLYIDGATVGVPKPAQNTMSTQTEDVPPVRTRESRGSQCVRRRKVKTTAVGIESTHTQTAESAVTKIKKRRSRRKSVAITTEPSASVGADVNVGQPVWIDFKELLLFNNDSTFGRSVKNTTSTQTGANKILCDSQTLTDDYLFSVIDEALKGKDVSDCCNTDFPMLSDMTKEDPMMGMTSNMTNNNIPILDMFGTRNNADLNDNSKTDSTTAGEMVVTGDPDTSNFTGVPCDDDVFSVFCESDMNSKVASNLSDIHTQTNCSNILQDFNLLANMETQTTDDFSLYDLEFSDTETQTPWDDFPNIDDSPLPTDQFSIEIQTDFSSLSSGIQQDPYGFINGFSMPGVMSTGTSRETSGVNSETQTHDKLMFPQLTNSESQTLDLSNFFLPK